MVYFFYIPFLIGKGSVSPQLAIRQGKNIFLEMVIYSVHSASWSGVMQPQVDKQEKLCWGAQSAD